MKNIKKISKILSIVMVAIIMINCFCVISSAADSVTSYNPNGWKSHETSNIDTTDVGNFSASIINIVAIVGSAAAIVTLIILGIKYMMGSAEEKAEYKKTLLPYIIGAAMVFGASLLVGVIYNFMNQG